MESPAIKLLWITIGSLGSLFVGAILVVFRNVISKNATKENVEAKTNLLEKDINHVNKELITQGIALTKLDKELSELRDDCKESYVSKELFNETLKGFNEKLDMILKFVKK